MSDLEKDQENLGEEKSEDPSFDPKLKKKKKKKPVFEDAEQPETNEIPPETNENRTEEIEKENRDKTEENEEQAEEDDAAAMFSDLKKKKKKKKNVVDDEKPEEEPAETGEFGDLSTLKKKKKKKPADLAAFEEQLKDGEDEEDRNEDVFVAEGEEEKEKPYEETWLGTDRDYTYQELLGRVFKIIRQNNPELAGEKKRYTIVPPSVHREGNKKTIFANIADICKRMHRQPEHTIQFLFAELGTSGSIDGSQRLVIKGRFQQKQIENVLRRYIVEYVTCKTCKSPDTILTKENRIFFMQCESCGSQRSVSAIKSGYHAQIEKRAVQRRAAQ